MVELNTEECKSGDCERVSDDFITEVNPRRVVVSPLAVLFACWGRVGAVVFPVHSPFSHQDGMLALISPRGHVVERIRSGAIW